MSSILDTLKTVSNRRLKRGHRSQAHKRKALRLEVLENRKLLTAAIASGDWNDPSIWDDGVPTAESRAIIEKGVTVHLDGSDHVAGELVIQGNLVVPEEAAEPDKTLETRWVHVNSDGVFQVGTETDRYDQGTFTLELTGTDPESDHTIEGVMMTVMNNDGFLMTGGGGRIEFYGEDKLSFTKLADSVVAGADEIIVEKVIERNYDKGASNGAGFVTSAADDGEVNWEIGDQIVIASSSYDYTEEDVRTITEIDLNHSDRTAKITLDRALDHNHYGKIEVYGDPENAAPNTTPASQTYQIDMRAEVALLSRNVKIQSPQGENSQDTDVEFGDRQNVVLEPRFRDADGNAIASQNVTRQQARATGLSHEAAKRLPNDRVANGIGGHIMIMGDSGQIVVDGVQMDGLGQAGRKGRYPIHWHLGGSREEDLLRNSSVTNSNNRGVTIHGTSDLEIEGVVLHDIHGHGFFFEDAVETGNQLVANIALGIHTVGGNDANFSSPGTKDPFIVDTHDSVLETGSRFSNSSAFWITNPSNVFVGNIAAGAGDSRTDWWADPDKGNAAGTGFWYALPRAAIGASALNPEYANVNPIFAEFGQFDYNTSHTTAVGLNFDRGSDIEDGRWIQPDENGNVTPFDFQSIQLANVYAPRVDGLKENPNTENVIAHFTNYKATGAAFYHRGDAETIQLDNLRVADSYNGPWAVSENKYDNSLLVGHSQGNSEPDALVGGPRLYDGAGLYTNTHFAGFGGANAYAFQVEGSSFGPTMYHAFADTSFEDDGTYDHLAHAVSDFQRDEGEPIAHDLGQPYQWIKAVMDLDGTLTGAAGGGAGYSIVPDIDFLVEDGDTQPAQWDAFLTDDIYARVTIGNNNNGEMLFPGGRTGEPLMRFEARDGDRIDVIGGQNNGDSSWIQIVGKTDGDGEVEGTLTVEFGKNGLPESGFDLTVRNQDGDRPSLNPAIQEKIDAARIVVKIVGAANHTPNQGTEVTSETELRSATSGIVYFRDGLGNLYFNTGISDSQPRIQLAPGAALQTAFATRTVQYGTVIEAEAFDNGIDGIAYHDTDATNSLGSTRVGPGVDATDTKVGDIADGEWLEYTTAISGTGYNIGVDVASTQAGGQIRVLAAVSNSAGYLRDLGTINVPNTNGEFSTLWLESVDLTYAVGPESVIRLEFIGGGFEVDSIRFAEATQTPYPEGGRTIAANSVPSLIQLEEFDNGGQGVAYYDDTAGNDNDGDFREDEDVDTNETQVAGKVFDGEWLEYTTDIEAGIYDITLLKKWGGESSGVRLLIGESNSATEFTELGVFDFMTGDNDEFVTLENVDLSPWGGVDRALRIEIIGNWMGLDSLQFDHVSSDQSAYVSRTIANDVTTRIKLNEFDNGGHGISYVDTTNGNDAGDFRSSENVDTNGDILTNDVFEGEWLEYTTDIQDGTYAVTLKKAWSAGDAGVKLLIADSNAATQFTELGVFEFGNGPESDFVTIDNVDLTPWTGSGRVLRVEVIGNWMGLDYLEFTEFNPDQIAPTADIVDVSPDPRNTSAGVVTLNFDEDVTGVDISDLKLSRDGETIDISDLTLNRVSASEYVVDLSSVTGIDGNYELRLTSVGSDIKDLAGNAMATDAIDQFLVDRTGPQVESVVVNDGSDQRSMVTSLSVTFSEIVNGIGASNFVLMNTTTNIPVTTLVSTEIVNGKTVATLTFTGGRIVGGSLADGDYTLTTRATYLTDVAGNQLDGNGDGIGGDHATDDFFRLFGDSNGDQQLDVVDFFGFLNAVRGNDIGAFDYDANGAIDVVDFSAFVNRIR